MSSDPGGSDSLGGGDSAGRGGSARDRHHHVAADHDSDRPGLAPERTDLAWTRSTIAFIAVGAAIVKIQPVVGIPVMAVGVVIWLLGRLSPRHDQSRLASKRLLLVTIAVTILAVACAILTLAGPSSGGLRF